MRVRVRVRVRCTSAAFWRAAPMRFAVAIPRRFSLSPWVVAACAATTAASNSAALLGNETIRTPRGSAARTRPCTCSRKQRAAVR